MTNVVPAENVGWDRERMERAPLDLRAIITIVSPVKIVAWHNFPPEGVFYQRRVFIMDVLSKPSFKKII
jgi:hypothetical protein